MTEKILITSALPYANGPLHFGHIAGAYLPADAYARFQRMQGAEVLYLCGSDEYGVAITLSAEQAKRTPKEHVDHFHKVIQDLFHKLDISFDHYSRTTWEGHVETVQNMFLDLLHNGHIEERMTEQLFSEKEGRFLADRYVQGICPKCSFDKARGDECQSCGASYEATDLLHPISKISGASLIRKETKHWFLCFDHFQEPLHQWLMTKNWKGNVSHFALSYIKDLKGRAITRDSDWGVPVPLPGTKGKVLYVWFDAPIGYISAAKEWAVCKGDPRLWEKYWLDSQTRLVQFIGKDNIPFHAIFFPAMLMGQNTPYKMVDDLPANEFYTLEGKQFSKSDGWIIDLEDFFHHFTVDQIRYTIAATAPETGDAEFSWKEFQLRCNSELLGKYGNFVNRVLVFVYQKMEGKIPALGILDGEDQEFLARAHHIIKECEAAYRNFSLRKATHCIMELAQWGNVYFDAKKPWQLIKDPTKINELCTVLHCCMECMKLLSIVSYPIIPSTACQVYHMVGGQQTLEKMGWKKGVDTPLQEGQAIEKPRILFAKVEDDIIAKNQLSLHSVKPLQVLSAMKEQICLDDVRKIDLRVACIVHVERMKKSKKLLQIQVDIGSEIKQVVAGIGEGMEDITHLIGKKVIFVANLQPAFLMGVESQGMLLACKGENGFELPYFVSSRAGDVIS